ncbi:hypothetical protein [Variovorax paradoxus]|uniref:hypothetical protein n=1 Tax=Variovorax paradoxus TaxID=34073 RepID=UPI0029C83F7E|nr:hypothetical protein [Variovorax paradoxus]WPH18207.1 hypothetical protein RZE78_14310 [Variovorax paradoxus]
MTTLNYDNAAALINAFNQGAKFKLVQTNGTARPVTSITAGGSHGIVIKTSTSGDNWAFFRPNGTNSINSARLIRDESLGFERTSVTVGDSIFGWVPPAKAPTTPASPSTPEPLLQRLLKGETFHCPKTRETLDSFLFSKGELVVALKGEDGKLRTSTNYTHDGKHKWHGPRTLVAGPVPPKAPVVPEYTSKDLESGKAPVGVYKSDTRFYPNARFIVLGRFPASRTVIYVGSDVEKMHSNAWTTNKFVKTDEKASDLLAGVKR